MTATTTPATRFDLDNLNTAAHRDLADRRQELEQAIAAHTDRLRLAAATMTVAELKEQMGDDVHGKPANKGEWAEAFVKQQVANGPAAKALKELKTEATRDYMLAHRLNDLLKQSDDADAELRQIVAENSGRAMFSALSWKIDNAFTAQTAAAWAKQVLIGYTEGHELREVALHVLTGALRKALTFPSHVRSNGLSGGNRMEEMVEALGAVAFRDAIAMYLPVDAIPMKAIAF